MPVLQTQQTAPAKVPPFWRINRLTPTFVQNVGEAPSTFTLSTQYFDWQAQRLTFSVGLAPMTRDQAAPAIAALLQGRVTPFLFGPIGKNRFPRGDASVVDQAASLITVRTAASQGAATLAIATPLVGRTVFKALDYIQVGNNLYAVLKDVTTDNSGNATITLFNRLRADVAINAPITYNNPQGLFRVAGNSTKWDEDVATVVGLGFDLVESF